MADGSHAEITVSLENVSSFYDLARDLRDAGAKSLQKELYAGLNRATRPAINDARASAEDTLPAGHGSYRGGGGKKRRRRRKGRRALPEALNMRVANSTYTSRVVRKGKTVRLTITAKEKTGKPVGLADLDQGRLRHPLFGNRREWYPQTVPTGWFTKPMQAQVKNVDKELGKAVDAVVAQFNEKR